MSEDGVKLINTEIDRVLKGLADLTCGTDEYATAIEDATRLQALLDADRHSRSEITKTAIEADKEKAYEAIESQKVSLQKDELRIKATSVKNEKVSKLVEAGTQIVKIAGVTGVSLACIFADQNGWFISRTGLSVTPKIHL